MNENRVCSFVIINFLTFPLLIAMKANSNKKSNKSGRCLIMMLKWYVIKSNLGELIFFVYSKCLIFQTRCPHLFSQSVRCRRFRDEWLGSRISLLPVLVNKFVSLSYVIKTNHLRVPWVITIHLISVLGTKILLKNS